MKGKKTYTVSPNVKTTDTAWDENGRVIACSLDRMPERTFEILQKANAYIRECKAQGFHGVRVNDHTGQGTFF